MKGKLKSDDRKWGVLVGCGSPGPVKGGKATTKILAGQVVEQSVVQGENPLQASRQEQETVKTRTYALPVGSRLEKIEVGVNAFGAVVTNIQSAVVAMWVNMDKRITAVEAREVHFMLIRLAPNVVKRIAGRWLRRHTAVPSRFWKALKWKNISIKFGSDVGNGSRGCMTRKRSQIQVWEANG